MTTTDVLPDPTTTVFTPASGSARRRNPALVQGAISVGVLIVIIGLWEASVQLFGIPIYVAPAPSDIVETFLVRPGYYIDATLWTGLEAVLGLIAAVVFGVAVALAVSASRILDRIAMPYLVLLQVTPTIAIAPLMSIWFGFGFTPKVVVAFLSSFFPIIVSTAIGLRSTDRDALDMLKVIAAPGRFVFFRARIPFALPHFLGSLKIAAPAAVIGAMVGEFVSSTRGLGYVIMTSQASLRTGALFVAIIGSALLGVATFAIATWSEKRFLRWHDSQID
ncbi:ABC transporter permease subunit [Nakamurella sp. YIM 132087]|uniref:ABC transporter permease subunit n=1 Tax=Nakamurella alba TaxID=2665158 RepID=A0A7K1FE10_9ACTN|nr:ABC transporter permease [Nakamurella alba]MTD12342.1 ABC transporter permease subunit [Nakamurella alba]